VTAAWLLAAAWLVALVALGRHGRPARRTPSLSPAAPREVRALGVALAAAPRRRRRRERQTSEPRRPRHPLVGLAVLVPSVLLLHPLPGLALAATTVALRERRWRTRLRRIRAARLACLPSAIDHLVVAVAAGLTPRQALHLVAERGPPLLRPAFTDVQARLDTGEALTDALPRLVDTLGESARGLVRAITVAERDGAPLRSLLGHLGDDARRQRRHEVEATIRRLPVRLAFPLVGCILPAFLLLTVVPLLAAGFSRLGPIGP
jgi:tight adherence protein C